MGVGAAKRLNALKWTVIERIAWAWLLTIPASAIVAAACLYAIQMLHPGF